MSAFLIYEGKAAVALLVFYLFYRFLLKKETFHRLNRTVLVGTMLLSFLLPLCVITIRKPMAALPVGFDVPLDGTEGMESVLAAGRGTAWMQAGPTVLLVIFWTGVAVASARVLLSVLSIVRIVRQGKTMGMEDGCKITVTERNVEPFSWMRHIVLSRTDWEAPHEVILAHEKAHIRRGHSAEVLLVDILGAFQWFNPAVWMLRSDLQEIHEYEADDAVLRTGANIREYQYLLIKKAVGKSGYSVANSLNHSILKNRITMMSTSKSPLFRGLRALYVLPLVCLGLGLQARTVYVLPDKDSEKSGWIDPTGPENPSETGIVLEVRSNGKIFHDGKEIPMSEISAFLRGLDVPFPGTVVCIKADPSVQMEVIADLKLQLREAGALKVNFSVPSGKTVTRFLPPAPKSYKIEVKEYSSENPPTSEPDNLCRILIDAQDKILVRGTACQEDSEILGRAKTFLKNRGSKGIFLLLQEPGVSYGAYFRLQSLLRQAYDEVRDEKAIALYGKGLTALSEGELSEIYKLLPIAVAEAEQKK